MRRKVLFTLLAAVFFFLPLLALGEVYFRYFSTAGYVTPEILKSRSLQYVPSRFSKQVFAQKEMSASGWDGVEYRINARGYRGHDFEVPKPPGTVRIVVYGGSAVFDLAAPEGNDWPHQVERLLRERGHSQVEVINAGTPNHASWDAVGRLFAEGHAFQPDHVVLYAAWNDIKYFREDKVLLRAYSDAGVRKDPRLEYRNGLDRFLCETFQTYVRLRARYYDWKLDIGTEGIRSREEPSVTISIAGPIQYRLNLAMFVDLARNIGAEPILVTQARLVTPHNTPEQRERIGYRFVSLTHDALCQAYAATDRACREVAQEKGAGLVDASLEMTGQEEWFRDHVHLNAAGSARLAELLAEFLDERLRAGSPEKRLGGDAPESPPGEDPR
jgi:lysophospholipase L1-like esterase